MVLNEEFNWRLQKEKEITSNQTEIANLKRIISDDIKEIKENISKIWSRLDTHASNSHRLNGIEKAIKSKQEEKKELELYDKKIAKSITALRAAVAGGSFGAIYSLIELIKYFAG